MVDAWTRKRFPRFKEGDLVVLTKEAVRANIRGRGSIFGIVLPPSRFGRLSVRVRRVDQKRAGDYHVTFWRHMQPEENPTLWAASRSPHLRLTKRNLDQNE